MNGKVEIKQNTNLMLTVVASANWEAMFVKRELIQGEYNQLSTTVSKCITQTWTGISWALLQLLHFSWAGHHKFLVLEALSLSDSHATTTGFSASSPITPWTPASLIVVAIWVHQVVVWTYGSRYVSQKRTNIASSTNSVSTTVVYKSMITKPTTVCEWMFTWVHTYMNRSVCETYRTEGSIPLLSCRLACSYHHTRKMMFRMIPMTQALRLV